MREKSVEAAIQTGLAPLELADKAEFKCKKALVAFKKWTLPLFQRWPLGYSPTPHAVFGDASTTWVWPDGSGLVAATDTIPCCLTDHG